MSVSNSLSSKLIIDVVYLGEEDVPTKLAAISNQSWWSDKLSDGKVHSRTFSASGYLLPSADLYLKGSGSYVGAPTMDRVDAFSGAYFTHLEIGSHSALRPEFSQSIRLFKKKI